MAPGSDVRLGEEEEEEGSDQPALPGRGRGSAGRPRLPPAPSVSPSILCLGSEEPAASEEGEEAGVEAVPPSPEVGVEGEEEEGEEEDGTPQPPERAARAGRAGSGVGATPTGGAARTRRPPSTTVRRASARRAPA